MAKHLLFFVTVLLSASVFADGPYQATGIRIGEVTADSAIVWTRLTNTPQRVGEEAPFPVITYRNPKTGKVYPEPGSSKPPWDPIITYPDGTNIDTIEGACPAAAGEVRVRYRATEANEWTKTNWTRTTREGDGIHQFSLDDLEPGTWYNVTVEGRPDADTPVSSTVVGGFTTAPAADDDTRRVSFTVSTGQHYSDMDPPYIGFPIYDTMLRDRPDFFVHTGDILYYDELAKNVPLARWHWQRTYSFATNVNFHRQVASYFIKDDHDTWRNDCWPTMHSPYMGEFTFAQGQEIFLEQVPMREKTYRTIRWGKDLQIWLPEGRDYRSANTMKDGPDKTILGAEQKAWLKRTIEESDATFRMIISATPIVGPDRDRKNDNHSNAGFTHEGNELREFIASQENMYVICGDRHWQYVSVDDETGVREFSCGPASDNHAGGWKNENKLPEHVYLNVIGGYLGVEVKRIDDVPTAIFTHHAVDGTPLNVETHAAR